MLQSSKVARVGVQRWNNLEVVVENGGDFLFHTAYVIATRIVGALVQLLTTIISNPNKTWKNDGKKQV